MSNASASNPVLRIVHAAARYVVVDKPAGLLSVPGKGEDKADCVASRVRALFPAATGPLVVHRLDMDTSGLIVVALDEDAQRELSASFAQRRVIKHYVAMLQGVLDAEEGEIDLPIRMEPAMRPYQVVDADFGKPSVTRFRTLARDADRTLVRFEPLTGRTHQLRVHAADDVYLGAPGIAPPRRPGSARGLRAPIVGDVLYGGALEGSRLMLHAQLLSFAEPGSARRAEFVSEPNWGGC